MTVELNANSNQLLTAEIRTQRLDVCELFCVQTRIVQVQGPQGRRQDLSDFQAHI